jgi:hypothetical protein
LKLSNSILSAKIDPVSQSIFQMIAFFFSNHETVPAGNNLTKMIYCYNYNTNFQELSIDENQEIVMDKFSMVIKGGNLVIPYIGIK